MSVASKLAAGIPKSLLDELKAEGGVFEDDLLHGLSHDGATLVLITHDENIAGGFVRRIQMRDGEIVSDERQ